MSRLTKQQNKVINCLQNGFSIITGSEMTGAVIRNGEHQFNIGSRLFWNLYEKGLIFQDCGHGHGTWYYILTELGKTIKTKNIIL